MCVKKPDSEVKAKFDSYPLKIREKLLNLRELIIATSDSLELGEIEESLKWGELSYRVKGGSPIRFDWKSQTPSSFSLYFNCQTKLVDTFRELYSEELSFKGNREVVLDLSKPIPTEIIRHCIILALTYHNIKHLPLLGA